MSFNDLERGLAAPSTRPQSGTNQKDNAFLSLQSSISLQVFKITSNVQAILKLVDQLGTGRDTGAVRKALHDLTETTRDMVKRGTESLKQLSALQADKPQLKSQLAKTSHDFQLALAAFQNAQKVSAERQRNVVQVVKQAVEEDHTGIASSPSDPGQRRTQQLMQAQAQLSPHQLAHQESLIHEREVEIREIETGIHELNEIFRDLGTLVTEQGTMIDNIESNISNVEVDVREASGELTTASEYQRKAGRRAACLMIVMVVVVCVVLLAVLN